MPAMARNAGAGAAAAYAVESEDVEEKRVTRRIQLRDDIEADPFLRAFNRETGLLGVFETRAEKAGSAMADGSRKVTSIFVRERDPLTSARSVAELTQGERDAFRATFDEMDVDGSGQIDAEELVAALALIDKPASAAEAQAMIDEVDADGDGGMDFDEFLECIIHLDKQALGAECAAGAGVARLARARARGLARSVSTSTRALLARSPSVTGAGARAARGFDRVASKAAALVAWPAFDHFVIGCILLVGVATIVALEGEGWTGAKARAGRRFVSATEQLTTAVFIAECVVKIVAKGRRPLEYFTDEDEGAFNCFDFSVVVIGLFYNITAMRLLRLFKIMVKVPSLRVLTLGLVAGIKACSAIMLLLSLIMFLFAIVGVQVFGANDPAHFGSTVRAMLSLFVCATLSAWSEVYSINFFGCDVYDAGAYFDADDAAAGRIVTDFGSFDGYACAAPNNGLQVVTVVYFVSYTILAGFVILSLFISVITIAMFEIIENNKAQTESEIVPLTDDEACARVRALLADDDAAIEARLDDIFQLPLTAEEARAVAVAKPPLARARDACRAVSESPKFNNTVTAAIGLVGMLEAMEADGTSYGWVPPLRYCIVALFTLEALVKLVAAGARRYFADAWNKFDFAIVLLSYVGMVVDLGSVTALRLLKLLRVLRLLNSFPQLRSVTQSLIVSFSQVGSVGLMILIINFMFAAVGMMMFRRTDNEHFGTLVRAMMAVWRIETLDGWDELMFANMFGCDDSTTLSAAPDEADGFAQYDPAAAPCNADGRGWGWLAVPYFLVVVLIGAMVLPTVLIGVISISFDTVTEQMKEENKDGAITRRIVKYARDWRVKHKWADELLTAEQLAGAQRLFDDLVEDGAEAKSLREPEMIPLMELLGEKYSDQVRPDMLSNMFAVVDRDGDCAVVFPEFLWFLVFYKTEYARKSGKLAHVDLVDARQDSKQADDPMADAPVLSIPSRGPPLPNTPAPLITAECCCGPPTAAATASPRRKKPPLGGEDVDILLYTSVNL